MAKNAKKKSSEGLLKGRWTIWVFALLFSLLAAFSVLLIVGQSADRVQYYATATEIPARTPISMQNVLPVNVNTDGVPATALTETQIASGKYFAKVALPKGTPIVAGVVGPQVPVNYNLPPGYLAASIQVSPDRAVAGKIKTGDYIDIAAVDNDVSKVVMQHVLVLDVTVNPSSIAQSANEAAVSGSGSTEDTEKAASAGAESQQIRSGIPQVYTLAVSPENFTVLALLDGGNVLLGFSQTPPVPFVSAQTSLSALFAPSAVPDGGAGTENVFASPSASPAPQQP